MEEAQPAQVSKVRIYGTMGSAVGYMIRDFLHRSDIPYEWIELTTDESARKLAVLDSIHDSRLPVCLFPDGTRMKCPTVRQITEKRGGSTIHAGLSTIGDLWRGASGAERRRLWGFRGADHDPAHPSMPELCLI